MDRIVNTLRSLLVDSESLTSDQYELEMKMLEDYILLRNQGAHLDGRVLETGLLIMRSSSTLDNEHRFSNLYGMLFKLNTYGIKGSRDPSEIYPTIKDIIADEMSSKFWYEFSADELQQRKLPEMKLATPSYRSRRLIASQSLSASDRLKIFEGMEFDSEIRLKNVLEEEGSVLTTQSRYIMDRIKDEMDPNFIIHPIDYLLITLAFIKALNPSFVSVGVEYIRQATIAYSEPPNSTYPVIFSSEGDFRGNECYSYSSDKLRIVLNSHINLLLTHETHKFDVDYMELFDEVILFMLSNPIDGVTKYKKAFNGVNLYYGLRKPQGRNATKVQHLHPKYDEDFGHEFKVRRNLYFPRSVDCRDCQYTELDSAVWFSAALPMINKSRDDFNSLKLSITVKFINKMLLDFRPCGEIINDVVFVRSLYMSGGYSRSHPLLDFDASILPILERNEKYLASGKGTRMNASMFNAGYDITKRLLDGGDYPTSHTFKSRIDKWMTPGSAGLSSISVSATVGDRTFRSSMTAKSAYSALLGKRLFDISTITNSTIKEDDLWKQVRHYSDYKEMMRVNGVSRVGSRATTAGRPIRPIYMVEGPAHIAFAAVIGPHITASNGNISEKVRSPWITGGFDGTCIATHYMDGTDSLIAPAVVASTVDGLINLQSDSSSWDMTYVTPGLRAYYSGMHTAFTECSSLDDEYYMYNRDKGMRLSDICVWLDKFQMNRLFIAEYHNETRAYLTNYMLSGRLDTFYNNSTRNTFINEYIAEKLTSLERIDSKMVWLQVAGDDAINVISLRTPPSKEVLNQIRKVVVDEYEDNNHIINIDKTVISGRSGEYAKLYFYCGMVFRDPSVQMVESEKKSSAPNRIDVLRGLGQKMYELTRRSHAKLRMLAAFVRFMLWPACFIKVEKRNDSSTKRDKNIVYKYMMPPQVIIAPTGISSGLGASYTGLLQNEVVYIKEHLLNCRYGIASVLHVLESIEFSADELFNKVLFLQAAKSNSIGRDLIGELGVKEPKVRGIGSSRNEHFQVKYDSNDPAFIMASFDKGLNYKLSLLKESQIQMSRAQGESLKSRGLDIPKSFMYENQPTSAFFDAIMALKRPASLRNDAKMKILSITSSLNARGKKMGNNGDSSVFSSLFRVQCAFNFELIRMQPYNSLEPVRDSIRYPNTPVEVIHLQRILDNRSGVDQITKLRSSTATLAKFIAIHNINKTEDQILDLLRSMIKKQSGMHGMRFEIMPLIYSTLVAMSGDTKLASETAEMLARDPFLWTSESISTAIVGTNLEYLHMDLQTLSERYIMLGLEYPLHVRGLISFIGLRYFLSAQVRSGFCYSGLRITPRPEADEVLDKLSLFGTKRKPFSDDPYYMLLQEYTKSYSQTLKNTYDGDNIDSSVE